MTDEQANLSCDRLTRAFLAGLLRETEAAGFGHIEWAVNARRCVAGLDRRVASWSDEVPPSRPALVLLHGEEVTS